MRRTTKNQTMAVALAVLMACTMTGCGKQGGQNTNNNKAAGDAKNYVYAAEDIELSGYIGDLGGVVVGKEKLYFNTWEWIEGANPNGDAGTTGAAVPEGDADAGEAAPEGDVDTTEAAPEGDADTTEAAPEGDAAPTEAAAPDTDSTEEVQGYSKYRIYSAGLDGSNVTEIPFVLGQTEYINQMFENKDGMLVLLVGSYDPNTGGSEMFCLKTIDASGAEVASLDLTKSLKLSENEYINKFYISSTDKLIALLENKFIVMSEDGSGAKEIKLAGVEYINGCAQLPDGQFVVGLDSGQGKAKVQVVNMETGSMGEQYELSIPYFNSSDSLLAGDSQYDFYYKDNKAIYGYKISTKEDKKVLDFFSSELKGDSVGALLPIGDGVFFATLYDYSMGRGNNRFVKLTKVDPSQVKDKKTLTLATLWSSDEVQSAIIKFNKENDSYRIELKEYNSEDADNDPMAKLNADIIAGNVPDIIDLSNCPVSQYMAMGLLADMKPFLDNDADVSASDLVDNVVESWTNDGKIYFISPSFNIQTLLARKSDVGDATGWTMEEMLDLIEKKNTGKSPFGYSMKADVLSTLLWPNMDEFTDWNTGKCTFDSPEFLKLLEIANTGLSTEPDYSQIPELPQQIASGETYLVNIWSDFDSFQVYKQMFNDDISYIGYPTADKNGSYFTYNSLYGISSKCEDKEAAWEFLKYFLSKDYQYRNGWYGMPSRKDVLEMIIKQRTATETYTDEYGEERVPYESSWGWGDSYEVKIGPMSPEIEKQFRDVLANTHKMSTYSTNTMSIVLEEAAAYFNGDKSAAEVAKIINSRISTYVNENR